MKSKVERINWITYHIRRQWDVGRLQIVFEWRKSTSFMGRFGGGWQWAVGFEAGPTSVAFNLLVASLRFTRRPRATVGDLLKNLKSYKSYKPADMTGWPKSRDELLCPHSVGHPIPGKNHHGGGVHGCDGCCTVEA